MATPEEEEQVRRLLGSAGPVRMPDDVRDRLQRVVADLAAERTAADAAGSGPSGQEPEYVGSGTRPQRRWPRLLVAAAVVALLGTGVGVAATQLGGGSSGGSSGAGSASSAQESQARAPVKSQQPNEVHGMVPSQHTLSAAQARAQSMLHSDSLRADIRRVEHFAPQLRAAQARRVPRGCATPATRPGDQVFPVLLDGRKASLLLQPPKDGTRVARVYPCDDPRTPLARTAVPVR